MLKNYIISAVRSLKKKYGFSIVNILGLGKWENKIGDTYGINATPTYFVLDKDKKIVAKPEDFEGLMEVLSKKAADK